MSLRTLLVVSLLLPAACAPSQLRGDIGAIFPQAKGNIGLQDSGGSHVLAANMNDLHDQLGVGDAEASPYLRLQADWERQRVRASGFGYSATGSGTLAGDYGNLPAGTPVTTSLQFFNLSTAWSYDLLGIPGFRLAPGVQLDFLSLDLSATSASPSGYEKVATDVAVPQLYVDGEIDLGPFALQANLGVMSADLGDGNGRYVDGELMGAWTPFAGFEVLVGYRYIVMDVAGRADSRDFDADVSISGWMIGGGVRF